MALVTVDIVVGAASNPPRVPPSVCTDRAGADDGWQNALLEVAAVKILIELILCIFHPIAVILMWINLAGRTDIGTLNKVAWAIFGLIPLVPFIYVLTGGDLY